MRFGKRKKIKLLYFYLNFTGILIGASGLGKSTMVNTLFSAHLVDSKGRMKAADPSKSTTEISQISHCMYPCPFIFFSPFRSLNFLTI